MPLIVVLALVALAWLGTGLLQLQVVFGVIVPFIALLCFIVGFIYRVVCWGRSAVPFKIPVTAGQQKSLPWIKQSRVDNPSTTAAAVGRVALEVLLFRSLFKNTRAEKQGDTLGFGSAKWLWLGALVFHWSLLIVVTRHLRLFLDPVPQLISKLNALDSFFDIGIPALYVTSVLLLGALTFLFLRRVLVPRLRYLSLGADYLPLFLLLGIAISGILMRHFSKVDVVAVKEFALSLVALSPVLGPDLAPIFFIHLFLVSSLLLYFPLSKLMHAAGIFFVPTRNLPNDSRMKRHINPWNYAVKTHSYEEYEDEFREKMIKAGLPVEYADGKERNEQPGGEGVAGAEGVVEVESVASTQNQSREQGE